MYKKPLIRYIRTYVSHQVIQLATLHHNCCKYKTYFDIFYSLSPVLDTWGYGC